MKLTPVSIQPSNDISPLSTKELQPTPAVFRMWIINIFTALSYPLSWTDVIVACKWQTSWLCSVLCNKLQIRIRIYPLIIKTPKKHRVPLCNYAECFIQSECKVSLCIVSFCFAECHYGKVSICKIVTMQSVIFTVYLSLCHELMWLSLVNDQHRGYALAFVINNRITYHKDTQ